jgi:hypothetical protein
VTPAVWPVKSESDRFLCKTTGCVLGVEACFRRAVKTYPGTDDPYFPGCRPTCEQYVTIRKAVGHG